MDATQLALSVWTIVCAGLVLFMQAGFCCLESGAVRHKNSVNVALKNVIDFCASFAAYFVIGYSLMFGATKSGLIGTPDFLLSNAGLDVYLPFLFQATFCSTAATIVSGGIAERCRFLPYLVMSFAVGIVLYPLFGHWVWGGGWLQQMGYKDFAGSSVVHLLGAGVTLAGIQVLGPRAGRFDSEGRPQRIPSSSMPMVALGVLILVFGWIGFNGGSAPLGEHTPLIIVNTLLAAALGGLVALLGTWAYGGLAAVDLILNGVLGGLVAITAGADVVAPAGACMIGIAGGLAVVLGSAVLEKLKLDDAVGAVPVHGIAGASGVLLVPLFITPEALAVHGAAVPGGLSAYQLFTVQALGVTVCFLWSWLGGLLLWWLISKFMHLRISPFEEQVGLNYSEHRVSSSVQDMATAVAMARQGLYEAAQGKLDNGGDAELAELSASLSELIRHTRAGLERMKHTAQALGEAHRRLDGQSRAGGQAVQDSQRMLEETLQASTNLRDFLEQSSSLHPRLPILGDLVRSLVEKLHALGRTLPDATAGWQGIAQAADSLAKLARGVQEAAR